MYSVKEAAQRLGISDSHCRRLLGSGQIRGKKFGHDWIVLSLKYQRKRKLKGEGQGGLVNKMVGNKVKIKSQEEHFANKVGGLTLTMLFSYRETGLMSRTFMLRQHSEMLDKMRKRSGHYKEYTKQQLLFLETEIYVEIVERLCYLIEDFTALCYALAIDDLWEFPQRLIKAPSPTNILKTLKQHSTWFTLQRYPDINTLDFPAEDKQFLHQHYNKNISVLQNFAGLLGKFVDLYWIFFTKRKHANTLVRVLSEAGIDGEKILIIPTAYDHKQPDKLKGIPFSQAMYAKQQSLFNGIFIVTQDLINRAIGFIERNGKPILEYATYYEMKQADKDKINELVNKYDSKVKRRKIEMRLELTTDRNLLSPFLDFYKNFDIGAFGQQ